MPAPTRQLAAIMFTDMVGYTALMHQNEALALEKKNKFRECFEENITKHDGKIVQFYGDGVLCMFTSASNAVRSALEIQSLYLQPPKVDARIGIHVGEIMIDEAGAYGDGVNIASRIESLAVPGSIFISDRIFDEIRNQQDITTKPLGYFELKNISQPMQVYAIAGSGVVVPSRNDVHGKVKESPHSIAVLPFVSLSADPENEYFCDGLTEEMINVLAKIDGIQVTSRTSAFSFKGKNEDIREIAGRLNVQKIIEGSVRKSGNKVRITVQLINASDGYHVWSESYDRQLEDIFDLQDDISRTIANKLRANLATSEHELPLVSAPTENLEAYKKYLQGLHYWNKQTLEDILSGLKCFHEAVALEPGFVNPYFNIVYITSFLPHAGILSIKESYRICKEASEKAMEIDPLNARSLLAAGMFAFYFQLDMEKTKRCFYKAIELNPNLSEAQLCLGWYRLIMQERDQMEEPLNNAHRLDPLGGETLAGIAELYFLSGKLDSAESYCNEALSANQHNMYAFVIKSLVTGMKGNWEREISALESIHQVAPEFNLITCYLGYAYARTGHKEKTEEFLSQFLEMEKKPDSPPVTLVIALLYLVLGEKEKFYKYYEESIKAKVVTSLYVYNSPLLADVNGEERIKELRRKYKLPE